MIKVRSIRLVLVSVLSLVLVVGFTAKAKAWKKVTAGDFHTCAIRNDNTLACWGNNDFGQSTPPGGTFIDVDANAFQTCGVKNDENVTCWGAYSTGATPAPPFNTSPAIEVSAGQDWGVALLKTSGFLICWGNFLSKFSGGPCDPDPTSSAFPNLLPFTQVSCGASSCCGISPFGSSVYCWGYNLFGEATYPGGSFKQVSLEYDTTCGIRSDDTVVCWGRKDYGQATPPAYYFKQISVGADHACGVRTDGWVSCWGDNLYGESSPPAGTFSQVSCGFDHTCGLMTNGTLTCWGHDGNGQAPALTLNPETIANGVVGQPYSQSLAAAGGTAPVTFTWGGIGGAGSPVPEGLTLSSGGLISGTPTAEGTYTFLVNATDSNLIYGQRGYSLTVTSPPSSITLSPSTLSNGTMGQAYSQTITAAGGMAPYSFTVAAGNLPAGLLLSPEGLLSGTPTAFGIYAFIIKATGSNLIYGQRTYSLAVTSPPSPITLDPSSLSNGTKGQAYSQTITAAGGTAPYSFTVAAGTLPAGLLLSPGGLLNGTPTAVGIFTFIVNATDSNLIDGQRAYSLSVTTPSSAITLDPLSLSNGTVGQAYTQTITATGGTAPYSFTIAAGSLPAGMFLSPEGLLSGTPATAGTYNFTIGATDSNFFFAQRAYSLTVKTSPLHLPIIMKP